MDDTRSALFGQFREEVDTHLLQLQQGVIALEQNPTNAPLINEVFRFAHTIKGAARMMGFAEIARVTHEMESVLGVMREGRLLLTADISDLFFEGIDAIGLLTQLQANPADERAAQARTELDLDSLVARLKAVAEGVDAPVPETNGVAPYGADEPTDLLPEARPVGAAPLVTPFVDPPEAGGSARGDGALARRVGDNTVRVPVQKLDTLMNLSGAMIITRMQHRTITERVNSLLEMERNRTRHLAGLSNTVERSWGALNQADMEEALGQLRQLDTEIDEMTALTLREFQDYANRLDSVAEELEDTVLSVRMLPVETLFSTFPRAVRDFKRETGKEVDLQIRGGDTELDKQILEALNDPLIHLLRNALDHGIELPAVREARGKPTLGRVTIHAYQQGTQVVIEVADDGAGIDPDKLRRVAVQKNFVGRLEAEKLTDEEALNLVFYPGFSTASIITDVSGRGVGMDIVKSTVEQRLNGSVSLDSRVGAGTRVTLRLPLTLATMQALLVRVGSQVFVLPSHTIDGGMDYIGPDDIFFLENREVVRLNGRTMPLVRLEELLDLSRVESGAWLKDAGLQQLLLPSPGVHNAASAVSDFGLEEELYDVFKTPVLGTGIHLESKLPGIVVGSGERQACFLVDELIDELDVVVKNLGPLLGNVETAMGATILGNGRVVIILDVLSLLIEARNRSNRGQLSRAWRPALPTQKPRILVVDDSITTRELEKSILENAGYDVDIAMDGLEALSKLDTQDSAAPLRYDLVIADIEMPRMDGLDLTQRIKTHPQEKLRALPVIIVSSLASEAYKQRGIEVGAQAYITKGQFDQSRLLETIDLLIH